MWYPTDHTLGLQRNGVNHVGMENPFRHQQTFPGSGVYFTEPVANTTYPVTGVGLLDKYAGDPLAPVPPGVSKALGMRSVRILFSWESVQQNPTPLPAPPFLPAAMGAVPHNVGGFGVYWTNLVQLVARLIERGVYIIVGPWQYNKAAGDTDITYNDASFEPAHFADFWGKFATAFNQAVKAGLPPALQTQVGDRLAFDLINEPHLPPTPAAVGITVDKWINCAKAAIEAIRVKDPITNVILNTNTIFVEGMGYGSPKRDTHRIIPAMSKLLWEDVRPSDPLNKVAISAHCYAGTYAVIGEPASMKPPDAMRNACKDLVDWARLNGFKIHIGEVALDAGVSACGNIANATAQWDNWTRFCLENDDVLVGWNWWANTSSPWGWSLEGSCSGQRNWALSQNNGTSWSTYVDLIDDSIPVPELVIHDNGADLGAEPNPTTMVAWESPDIWVRKTADGIVGDDTITGAAPCVVYVRVTNRGDRDYPGAAGGGNDIVALYWAKASTALSIPEPWNGKVGGVVPNPTPGGLIGSAAIGPLSKKTGTMIPIAWPMTPNPKDYSVKDGHFCLLAVVTKSFNTKIAEVAHEGLEAPLNPNVLKMNNVAWHNIHIAAPSGSGMKKLGAAVVANPTGKGMRASLRLEVLDAHARPVDPPRGTLRITLEGAALEKLRRLEADRPVWEDMGDGSFAVLDPEAAMPELTLQPGETLPLGLSYLTDRHDRGCAVRATQYEREGAFRRLVGGQTFVIGEVAGFTSGRRPVASGATWPWLVASGALLLLIAVLGERARPGR